MQLKVETFIQDNLNTSTIQNKHHCTLVEYNEMMFPQTKVTKEDRCFKNASISWFGDATS